MPTGSWARRGGVGCTALLVACLVLLAGRGEGTKDYEALLDAWRPLAAAPAPQKRPLVVAVAAIYKGENRYPPQLWPLSQGWELNATSYSACVTVAHCVLSCAGT
jgi:CHASE2 domain-containing sensor protein